MVKAFGEEFCLQRKRLDLSQEAVGKSIGVSRTYITLIEGGKRLPGKKNLLKIASALKIQKDTVINWYLKELRNKLS
ncbi:MAG: helix-turn-helix transcriptional regulator [bacterium]|nr:helix-turn-helix transcriptional regulator [bacterium]